MKLGCVDWFVPCSWLFFLEQGFEPPFDVQWNNTNILWLYTCVYIYKNTYTIIYAYDVICINLGVIHIHHSFLDLQPFHGKTRLQALCAGFVHSSWQVFLGFGWDTTNDARQIQASKQDCKVSRASYLGNIIGPNYQCCRDIIEGHRKASFGCKQQFSPDWKGETIGECQWCPPARHTPCKEADG